jgi:hypothetical protein
MALSVYYLGSLIYELQLMACVNTLQNGQQVPTVPPVSIRQLVDNEMQYMALMAALEAHPPSVAFDGYFSLRDDFIKLANVTFSDLVNNWHKYVLKLFGSYKRVQCVLFTFSLKRAFCIAACQARCKLCSCYSHLAAWVCVMRASL